MSTAGHKEVKELVDHLEEHLSALKEEEPNYHEWSDGDQLRGIAHSLLYSAHQWLHMIPGAKEAAIGVPRTLLRIAARLDTHDEEES